MSERSRKKCIYVCLVSIVIKFIYKRVHIYMYIRIYIGRGFKLVTLEDQDEKRAKRSSPLRWHGPSTPSPPAFTSGEASSVWYTHRHPSLKQPSRGRATVLILMERLMGELKGRKLKENKRRDVQIFRGETFQRPTCHPRHQISSNSFDSSNRFFDRPIYICAYTFDWV